MAFRQIGTFLPREQGHRKLEADTASYTQSSAPRTTSALPPHHSPYRPYSPQYLITRHITLLDELAAVPAASRRTSPWAVSTAA
jgi:hypothetical protein